MRRFLTKITNRLILRVHIFLLLSIALIAFSQATYADARFAHRRDVQAFIQFMVKHYGFKKAPLSALFAQIKMRPQIIRHINKPLEKELWHTYQTLFVSQWRIKHGVKFWNQYKEALTQAEQVYGIPASIIVATIGIETKYGRRTGAYRVIDSLSSIAFSSSPRAAFFRNELKEFLLLARESHLNPLKVMGSYAGAIGQPQFMPSSYRYYAVNFSKSGKIDLIHNEVDVIGSIANYYQKHGWVTSQPIAIRALAIGDRYHYFAKRHQVKPLLWMPDLDRYGIIPKKSLNKNDLPVKIIELSSQYKKEYWLGFHNFEVIKRYNPSDLYAMAVFQLSIYMTALRNKLNHG